MQTTADFITSLVELTTGVEHGHNNLKGRFVHFFVLVNGDATTVILHGYRFIFVDRYFNMCAIACHRFVDGVVNGLVHQMVQTLFTDIADVHRWAFAHSFKSLEHLNIARGIVAFFRNVFCHCYFRTIMGCKDTKNLRLIRIFCAQK